MERFFADSMLGKLALWMRVLGYDVEYEKEIDDDELVTRALGEGRTVLTRDTRLVERKALRGRAFFIAADRWKEQLRCVRERFKTPDAFLSRCLRCNVPLENIKKEEARDRVPPYVYSVHDDFTACPGCERIYWPGTHKKEMEREVGLG
jgi:uncharacterized protein with PIN domain